MQGTLEKKREESITLVKFMHGIEEEGKLEHNLEVQERSEPSERGARGAAIGIALRN